MTMSLTPAESWAVLVLVFALIIGTLLAAARRFYDSRWTAEDAEDDRAERLARADDAHGETDEEWEHNAR